jgi:hypothetical protein
MRIYLVLAVLLLSLPASCQTDTEVISLAHRQKIEGFEQALAKIAKVPSDACESPDTSSESSSLEWQVFQSAADALSDELHELSSAASGKNRAIQFVKRLEEISSDINQAWPEESRFKATIVDLNQLIVIKVSIRQQEEYLAFGIPEKDYSNKPNNAWERVNDTSGLEKPLVPWTSLEIHPIYRGPDHNARFLAKFTYGGCAGSYAVGYEAMEWNPSDTGSLDTIIEQKGAFGLGDEEPFAQIGKLNTSSKLLTLPYCWFSGIDSWDNPSMCAVDTYDLSADNVRFVSRRYNRPDLLPIAKAFEYAQQHDYPAALAYCSSPLIARKLVSEVPTQFFADDLRVKSLGPFKKKVEMSGYHFTVEKRNERWLITSFSIRQ